MPSGGMEMHARAFLKYWSTNNKYKISKTIAFSENNSDIIEHNNIHIVPKKYIYDHKSVVLYLKNINKKPDIFFFNSLYWLHITPELKNAFPDTLFVLRSGGNDILQSHILTKGSTHSIRRGYVISTINKYIDALIVNSNYSLDKFREIGIKDKKMHVVIGGVDHNKFYPPSGEEKNTLRKKLNIVNQTIIISVARLVKFKGISGLIEAFNYVRDYNVLLYIIGDGPDKESIQKKITDLNLNSKITLIGNIPMDNIDLYYKIADIYALTPIEHYINIDKTGGYIHTETMGRSFCEARSVGLPIVCTNVGGIPEVLKGYDNAYINEPGNTDSIKQSLLKAISDEKYAKITTVDKTHSWENIFKSYERIFNG